MPIFGNTSNYEKTSDRTTFVADGSQKQFGIQFSGENVQAYLNGVLMKNGTDVTLDANGGFIKFVTAPSAGDVVDCIGSIEITNLSRNTVNRMDFTATAGQIDFAFANFEDTDRIVVSLNGSTLHNSDYTQDYANNKITLGSGAALNDVVTIMQYKAGFRAGESLNLQSGTVEFYSNKNTIDTAYTIPTTANAFAVGPTTVNATLTVNGTFTII